MRLAAHVARVGAKMYGEYKKSYRETRDNFYKTGMQLIKKTLEDNEYALLCSPDGQYYVKDITKENVENK